MGPLSSCLIIYMKNALKSLQEIREFKFLKAGIVSTTFFGLVLSASNVFAQPVAPTTNTPYIISGTSIGANGQQGNKMNGTSCRAGNGFYGSTGSPSPLNLDLTEWQVLYGYGTGIYALATGGRGGDGGANTDANCSGAHAANGVTGGTGAPVNATWKAGYIGATTLSSTGIYAVSGGGNGGDGGRNNQGGDAGVGGNGADGGAVYVLNEAKIVTGNTAGSYGIFAQSYGGNGGRGGNSTGTIAPGDGGGGGYGGMGGSVTVTNQESIQSNYSIPIFAQSLGGIGGAGGDSTGGIGFGGGGGGNGGNGASADSVSVSSKGALTSDMVGGFGINAQSVGGSGGTAGASAGLLALGASGGEAATGGSITLSNLGAITLKGASSIGLFAQSVGGGGGSGGLATGAVAIGGSSGDGGGGAAVSVNNTGIINTGYTVSSTASTNGGAFGILAQSVGGGGGVGGMGISSIQSIDSFTLGVGGSGGGGGSGSQVVVANSNSITTTEPNSAAILAQSIGGGGGSGGGAVSISGGVFFGFGSGVGGGAGTGGAGGLVGVNCSSSSTSSSNPCYNTPTQSGGASATGGTIYFTAGSPASDALITTSGVGSPGILAQSVGGGGGNGGYAIQIAAGGDASLAMAFGGKAGAGGYGSNVYASPAGVNISTSGSDSPGLVANSTGGGGGVGGASVSGSFSGSYSAALSIGGTGGSGGNGSSVTAENLNNGSTWNASSITTTGARSYGIVAQSIGGGGGSGGASIALSGGGVASLALGLGGSGSVGGDANVVSLSNDGNITTSGAASSALIAQSIAGGGGNGGFDISGSASMEFGGDVSVGGRGGKGGTGMNVILTNSGSLLTQGGGGAVILAQSIGGGGGNGGFSGAGSLDISGSFGYSVGGSAAAGGTSKPVSVTNSGSITANNTSDSGVVAAGNNPGILAQAIGGNGGNGGVSVGAIVSNGVAVGLNVAGSGGVGGGAGDVTVTNSGTANIAGPLSSAIIAQSIGGNGGNGGLAAGGSVTGEFSFTSNVGGGSGSGGRSGVINVANSGALAVNGAMSSAILAQSIGGSGGNGGTAIAGSLLVNSVEDGGSAALAISVGGSGGGGAIANVVTVTNSAGITANGDQSGGIVAQAIGGSGGTGGNAIAGAVAITESEAPLVATLTLSGKGGNAGYANTTTVNVNNPASGNYTISTKGLLASGILAQSIGGGGGNAGSSFSGTASHSVSATVNIGSDGGAGGTAGTVNVSTGSGVTISTTGDQSSGIVAQSIGGSGGNGGIAVGAAIPAYENYTTAAVSVGGNGSSGGSANTVNVNNSAVINTKGMLSLGIIAQSIGGSGGNGGSTYAGSMAEKGAATLTLGGGSGSGGTANAVTVNNYDAITTAQSQSTGILAQSIGGVGGNGGISEAVGHSAGSDINIGIGGAGGNSGRAGAVVLYNSGLINVAGNQSFGLVAQSIGGSGGNGGESVSEGTARWGGSIVVDVGKTGGAGGAASGVNVTTIQNITTNGLNGIGILGQSIGGAGGNGINSISFAEGGQEAAGNESTLALTVGGSAAYNGTSQGVTITQTGNISTVNPSSSTTGTTNDQAAGIVAQSIGGNGGNGGNAITNSIATQGSISLSIGGQGIEGTEVYGANSNGVVNVYSNQNQSTGSITTDGMSAPAILAQSIGGGGGNGAWTQSNTSSNNYGVGFSLGGWGGNGGNANQVNVSVGGSYYTGTLTTTGQQSSAIIAQSIGGGGGNGGVATTQVSTSPGSNTNGLTSVVGAEINGLTGVGSQAATYLETNLVNTEQPTTSNTAPDSGVSTSMAVGGYGANSGTGNAVSVVSASIINTSGAQANGITAQSIGGGGGIGGSSTSGADGGKYSAALSVGGFGVAGGTASTVAVTNSGSIMTAGDLATGIFAQSVGGGGGSGSSSSTSSTSNAGGAAAVSLVLGGYGSTGGSSGTAGVADTGVGITNYGSIVTQGINSHGILAQSVGGGGGNGGSSSTSSNVAANSGSSGSSTAGTGGSSTPTTSNTANSSVAGNTASDQYSSQAGSDKGTAVGLTVGGYGVSGGFANNVSVTNYNGTIQTGYASTAALSSQRLALGLSDNSAAIFAQSVGGGGGSGGSATSNADGSKTSVSLALGGNAGTSGDAGTVTVNNAGSLLTNGNNSSSIFAQSVGGGGGNSVSSTSTTGTGGSNAVAFGLGGFGANAGFGNAVTVSNSQASSVITTNGALSHGIFAQSVGGGGGNAGAVNNSATRTTSSVSDNGTSNSSSAGAGTTSSQAKSGVSVAADLGGSGGSGGDAGVASVTNASQITTSGIGSYGIFAQSVGGGGGNSGSSTTESNRGAYSAAFALGMGGGGAGSSNQVNISSSNSVSTAGDNALGIFAQSVGGGGGNAGSTSSTSSSYSGNTAISMFLGGAGGASGNGNTVTVNQSGASTVLQTGGQNAIAILAQSVGGGGGSASSVIQASSVASRTATFSLGGGGAGGTSGNGGTINLTNAAQVVTSGDNAVGIFGQSVGGGGGTGSVAQTTTNSTSLTANFSLGGGHKAGSTSGGTYGDGGAVSITNTNSISTSGSNSIGVFGQSIGGGGGYLAATSSGGSINLNRSALGGNNGATGNGGAVNITQSGSVSTSGIGVVGIVAQSVGGGGGYVSFLSKDASGTINNGSNLAIGAAPSSSSNGNGGAVTVTTNSSVSATGANAIGILAQSVGGGGGAFVTSGVGTITPTYNAGTGYGGAVTINAYAPIIVSGNYARGILAESVGGGGGFAVSGNSVTHGGGKGTGDGGVVNVNINYGSYVSVSGKGAIAIYTSTVSGKADPFITIGSGSFVSASGGATAIAINGANNQLVNYGSILVGNALADTAVEILSPGVNDFQNHGTIAGKINNPVASTLNFTNNQGARFNGTLTNKGFIHLGGKNTVSVQSFTGRLDQTSTGILGINLDHSAGLSDLVMLEESGTFNLAGKAQANFLNAGLIKPGTTSRTETHRANSVGSTLAIDDAFTIDRTAIMSMSLLKSSTSLQLVSTANFAPAGLSPYASQVGNVIGNYQTAGSNAFFQAATAQLVTLPTVSDLEQGYNKLAGSAIQAMPQANYQAVTRAVGTVSDRMNSWRVGDSFINTIKNPRALMTGIASMNQPITPNAPQVANGTLAADGGEMPITSLAKSTDARTWITPFGGTSNSNNLAYQVYGGSLGIEAESDDRKFIGGAALTVSQSNYTYSSSTTPSTPGSATNYGASFYFGARHESAYLSAIGYLGGSGGSFNRQLQALNFNTSTGVNVHSNILSARVEAGYNLLPNPEGKRTLQVTPFVAIAPTQIRQNGANEYFGGLGSGFYYGSNINTAVPVSIGTEISGDLQLSNKEVLRPFLRVSWVHDLMSPITMSAATTSYGPTLYANGTPTMGNMVVLKGGAKYNLGNKISAYATLDLEQGNGAYSFRGIGGSLGAMYSW